jgi:hypothetical protein
MEIIILVRGDTLILTPLTIHMVVYATDTLISGGNFCERGSGG